MSNALRKIKSIDESGNYSDKVNKRNQMSKKIWRGNSRPSFHIYDPKGSMVCWSNEKHNATVIPDAACFPVKEAMHLWRDIWDAYQMEMDGREGHAYVLRGEAIHRMNRAVEQMKKKEKVKP